MNSSNFAIDEISGKSRLDGLEKSEGQKIGEIKTAEGSVIVFYKTSDGKIKKMKEESKK